MAAQRCLLDAGHEGEHIYNEDDLFALSSRVPDTFPEEWVDNVDPPLDG